MNIVKRFVSIAKALVKTLSTKKSHVLFVQDSPSFASMQFQNDNSKDFQNKINIIIDELMILREFANNETEWESLEDAISSLNRINKI